MMNFQCRRPEGTWIFCGSTFDILRFPVAQAIRPFDRTRSLRCTFGACSGYSGRYVPAGVPRCAGRGLECGGLTDHSRRPQRGRLQQTPFPLWPGPVAPAACRKTEGCRTPGRRSDAGRGIGAGTSRIPPGPVLQHSSTPSLTLADGRGLVSHPSRPVRKAARQAAPYKAASSRRTPDRCSGCTSFDGTDRVGGAARPEPLPDAGRTRWRPRSFFRRIVA